MEPSPPSAEPRWPPRTSPARRRWCSPDVRLSTAAPESESHEQCRPDRCTAGRTVTGGRLNVNKAIRACAEAASLSPPTTVFFDDFETSQGWTTNANGTDTATTGQWARANPETTTSSGTKQHGTTVSGVNDLVTGPLAGASVGANDIDGGVTSIQSPAITLIRRNQLHVDLLLLPGSPEQLLDRRLLPGEDRGRRISDHRIRGTGRRR